MTLPSFLIIGAAKSGTTALWHWLNQHPDIFLPENKEPSYFSFCDMDIPNLGTDVDQHYLKRLVKDPQTYKNLFETSGDFKHYGEASPSYLYYPNSAQNIVGQLPDIKIICIFRNPIHRAYSQFMHMVRDGFEDARSFELALDLEDERIEQGGWWGRHYANGGYYAEQWARYMALFDRSQCLTLIYEDFETKPRAIYERVCGFLGVEPQHDIDFSHRVNDTRGLQNVPRSAAMSRLLWQPNRTRQALAKALPAGVRESMKSLVKSLNRGKIPGLRAETKRYLWHLYRSDICRLEDMIGRNLSHWNPKDERNLVKFDARQQKNEMPGDDLWKERKSA